MVVYKFPLALVAKPQSVSMPVGATILHVDVQNGFICIWALVEMGVKRVVRDFQIVGTGDNAVDEKMQHLGTVLMSDGAFVWHVFELLR